MLSSKFQTTQIWEEYSLLDHMVWSVLYERRMQTLQQTACREYLEGMNTIGLISNNIPHVENTNKNLRRATGWELIPVKGFLPAQEFFELLAQRRFPTTITIRSMDSLNYVPEPDIFHDIFGHVPMHANSMFADLLQKFGSLILDCENEKDLEKLTRLFWFTVEFGLIKENSEIKIYGSGLISSQADAEHALSDKCERRPFNIQSIINQEFSIDKIQETLYVIDSFEQLSEALNKIFKRGISCYS